MTSLAFPTGDVNNFIVGSEEGTVYTACRHGSRAGILDSFEGMDIFDCHNCVFIFILGSSASRNS